MSEKTELMCCITLLKYFAFLLHILNMILAKHLFAADFDFVLICQL